MGSRFRHFLIGLLALAMFAPAPGEAQPADGVAYSQEELDQILAPVALYPDQLLMQVLIASTYPLEVIDAARFIQRNPNLRGEALDEAVAGRNWDPSVQSLTAFPQVLEMMNEKIDWMQRLGDAFLVDQQRVMDTVQALRARAQAQGNLQSTPQQSVLTQDRVIIIEPVQPEYVYVPYYNPLVVYGPWWAPAYEPWFWNPSPIYGYPVWGGISTGIYFGTAWGISYHHWGWARPDWHRHQVHVHPTGNRFWNRPGHSPPRPGGTWQHEPVHRRGVAYPDPATYDRFRRTNPDAVRSRQDYRGRDRVETYPNAMRPAPGTPRPGANGDRPAYGGTRPAPGAMQQPHQGTRPAPGATQQPSQVTRPAPGAGYSPPQGLRSPPRPAVPAFDPGVSRQQVETNALRGQQSRQSSPAPAMPSARPPSAPSHHAPSAPSAQPPASAPSAPSSRSSSGSPAPRGGVQKP